MTDSAVAGVPDGYQSIRTLASDASGRRELCRAADGREVVVRVTGVGGDASADLLTELGAAAAAAEHPCAVGLDRSWDDPAFGVCVQSRQLPGGSLADRSGSPLDADAVAAGGVRGAAALAFAHSRGVLHGDLRPANVVLDADGNWLVADIGAARAVARANPGQPITPDAAFAPRELRGWERPAPSADVFSLGAVLYAALAGTAPVPNSGATAVALTGVPAAMAALIDRMMAPNPADRPSLVEVDQVLRPLVPTAARGALPAAAAPLLLVSPPRPKLPVAAAAASAAGAVASGRNRVLVAAAAIGAIFLGGATAVAVGNRGGDDSKAIMTAATPPPATASPTPSSTPKPSAPAPKRVVVASKPAAVSAHGFEAPAFVSAAAETPPVPLTPYKVTVEPTNQNGDWQLYVHWLTNPVGRTIYGWSVEVQNLVTGSSLGTYPDTLEKPLSAGSKIVAAGYFVYRDLPLESCVRIRTNPDDPTTVETPPICPDPGKLRQAQGAQAAQRQRRAQQAVVAPEIKPAIPAAKPAPVPAAPPAKPAAQSSPKQQPPAKTVSKPAVAPPKPATPVKPSVPASRQAVPPKAAAKPTSKPH